MTDAQFDVTTWPSLETVILPSRAFLLSWREQTLPTREAAIADSIRLFASLPEGASDGVRDMAMLGVIADAMQPLEDLAYLATSWTEPFGGVARYVKATVYSKWTPASFWQRIHKRDDEYFDVMAGFSSIDPETESARDFLGMFDAASLPGDDVLAALERARQATRDRLRRLLGVLASDWAQFGNYFYAYKHGGLTVHRPDAAWVDDEITAITDDTPRRTPSLAVWHRGGKQMEGRGEFQLTADEIVHTATGTGRLAADLCDAFVTSRLTIFDSIEIADGEIVAVHPVQMPWTVWLREADLTADDWGLVGSGPRVTWEGAAGPDARRPTLS